MIDLLVWLAANALQPAPARVELVDVHADPGLYEGQVIETCGFANRNGRILYMKGWISGRSRGGLLTSEPFTSDGDVCVQAEVVRGVAQQAVDQDGVVVIVSHPPVLPEGWQLRLIRILND